MEVAVERISNCLKNGSGVLDISSLGLIEFPDNIPNNIIILYCSSNKIRVIKNLPESIVELWCSDNEIFDIINLPKNLKRLFIDNNKITKLPAYNPNIEKITCHRNKLILFPDKYSNVIFRKDFVKTEIIEFNQYRKLQIDAFDYRLIRERHLMKKIFEYL